MKNLKVFEEFHKKSDVLYRNTDFKWLEDFLKKGIALPAKNMEFISFSKDNNSGDDFDDEDEDNYHSFGDLCIYFDADELYKQSGQEIEYTVAYFKKHPNICLHVTDYNDENDFNKSSKKFNDQNKLSKIVDPTWKEFVKGYSKEQEVILTKIKMKPGLIKKVVRNSNDIDIKKIKNTLKKYNIM